MARPRLGDSESKRLQMVITEDELKAIDDWRFENRIENRSEAIRRLCQIAIYAMEIVEPHAEAYEAYTKQNLQSIGRILSELKENGVPEHTIEYVEKEMLDQFLKLATLLVEVSKLNAVAQSLTEKEYRQIAVKTLVKVVRDTLEMPHILEGLETDLLKILNAGRERKQSK